MRSHLAFSILVFGIFFSDSQACLLLLSNKRIRSRQQSKKGLITSLLSINRAELQRRFKCHGNRLSCGPGAVGEWRFREKPFAAKHRQLRACGLPERKRNLSGIAVHHVSRSTRTSGGSGVYPVPRLSLDERANCWRRLELSIGRLCTQPAGRDLFAQLIPHRIQTNKQTGTCEGSATRS